MFLAIKAGLVVVALALALTFPNLGSRGFGWLERYFGGLPRDLESFPLELTSRQAREHTGRRSAPAC